MNRDTLQTQAFITSQAAMNFLAPLKTIAVFAAAYVYAVAVSAQGVIANDAAILPLLGSGQYLTPTNSIDPSQGRYGLFAIQITSNSPSQYTFSAAGIAEEYALYDVSPGVAIDPAFAAVTTPGAVAIGAPRGHRR